jgi:hypothetical protein
MRVFAHSICMIEYLFVLVVVHFVHLKAVAL